MSKLLSYSGASQHLETLGVRLSPLTLRYWVSHGKIRFHKIGARVYFDPTDLERMVAESVVEPVAEMSR